MTSLFILPSDHYNYREGYILLLRWADKVLSMIKVSQQTWDYSKKGFSTLCLVRKIAGTVVFISCWAWAPKTTVIGTGEERETQADRLKCFLPTDHATSRLIPSRCRAQTGMKPLGTDALPKNVSWKEFEGKILKNIGPARKVICHSWL